MKKQFLYFFAIFTAVLIWAACDRIFDLTIPTQQEESGKMEYVSFTNHGCQGWSGLDKANSEYDTYLTKHRLAGDTLILTIHYWANCCPAFVDSVSIHDDIVDICIDDSQALCNCICPYDNDFTFLCPDTGALRVRFGWIGGSFELDTLIQIHSETYSFETDANSVHVESYPQWIVSRDALDHIAADVVGIQWTIYPEPSLAPVSKEFVITPGDSFAITITNSLREKPFGYIIDGKQILLARIDTLTQSSSRCTVCFRFKTTGFDKGYIAFFEQNGLGDTSISSESPGFVAGYTAGIKNPLWVFFEKLEWIHDTEGFSTVSVRLKGKTNACRLKLETYGDGEITAHEVPLNEDGSFDDNTGIAFSHVSGILLKQDTRLAVYGTVGYPKIILLKNPLNED